MKALVTGATGFVGTHLTRALAAAGWTVTALVRSPEKASSRLGPSIRTVRGTLDDADVLADACAGQDVVFHLAGLVAARTVAEFERVNVGGTTALAKAAEGAGARRLLLVSSLAAGGPSLPPQGEAGAGEERPDTPVTAYGRSKLAAEQAIRDSSLEWTILRPPTVYGPLDTELLRAFRAIRFGIAPVFGDGSQELSAVYGPDLADALVATAASPTTIGNVYYPAHPEVVTSRDLMLAIAATMDRGVRTIRVPRSIGTAMLQLTGAIARLSGRATILNPDKANEFYASGWTCDPSALTAATGWEARHDLRAGLAATLSWYSDTGWL